MTNDTVILTVSVTGGIGSADTPYLPITPRQIAESSLEAWRAGAAVAHIHVRDPETGIPSMKFEHYKEVVDRLRDHSDMIINLTTGPGARVEFDFNDPANFSKDSVLRSPETRVAHISKLKPEICTLDVGSMDFGSRVFLNYGPHVERMAECIRDAGVLPEMEVFTLGHVEIARRLIRAEKVNSPPLFQLCMGVPWGIPATPLNMIAMVQALPEDAAWAAFGISESCYPMLAQSILLGGNVRVGMEDNFYLEKGVRAKGNRELVEKAVQMMRHLGKKPATPDEARKRLGIIH